jgi:hypothetical protein
LGRSFSADQTASEWILLFFDSTKAMRMPLQQVGGLKEHKRVVVPGQAGLREHRFHFVRNFGLQKLLVRILKSFAVFTVAVVAHIHPDVFVIANRSKNAQKVAVKSKQVGIVESLYALVINLAVGKPVTKFAFDRDIKIVMWNPELNARDPVATLTN